jgi:hypothetical protein
MPVGESMPQPAPAGIIPQPMPIPVGQPMPQSILPGTQIQSGGNVMFPPAPVGSPVYQQPLALAAPMPGWPATAQNAPAGQPAYPGQGAPNAYGRPSYSPPAGPAPYANASFKPRAGRVRGGDDEPVFRVVHDHSHIGNKTYFEESCGGLLSVSGTNLTFTGSGGEAPRVIPASDILEIRLNSVMGRDAGVFHISTRQGLYLTLAPESQDREQARSLIEAIRANLSLIE